MTKTVRYKNASDFLKESRNFLTPKELENNMMLGICYNLIKSNEQIKEALFVNIFENGSVVASSIKIIPKAIIVASENNDRAIKESSAEPRLPTRLLSLLINPYSKNKKLFTWEMGG